MARVRYMVVRLSDVSSKTSKKCIFCVFRLFWRLCQTASRPYKLSHINALRINYSYTSKDQSQKFSGKNIENWRSPENNFCLVFWFLVIGLFKKFCFCFFSMKNTKEVLMRQHLFFYYGWFLQNLEKGCIQTNMHTTVHTESHIYSSNVADRLTVSKTGIHYFVKLKYSLCTIGQSYLFA